MDRERRIEAPGRLGEAARLGKVVESGNERIAPERARLGGVRKTEDQDFAGDPRPAQRDPLFGERDSEPAGPLLCQASRDGRRAVPVGVPLHDAEDRPVSAEAVRDAPVVPRDRAEVDHGTGGSHEPRRMSDKRCRDVFNRNQGNCLSERDAGKRGGIRTARERDRRSSRTSCGRRGTRAGSRPSARCAAWRR